MLSMVATNDGHAENSAYFDGWKAFEEDPFHPTQNPLGVIQMGLAENKLCFDLVREWVVSHPGASICTPQGSQDFMDIAIFQDYHGLPEFTRAVAKFMERVRGDKVAFDPNRIVMSGGATGAHETLAFCLANPGEAFLVPTPYYPGFNRDLKWRTGAQLYPVLCESSNAFMVTRAALELAYEEAQEQRIKVRGLLINNPSNPLGTVLDRDTLRDMVSFINDKNIHLICDEIYAGTVFSEPQFVSIAEIIEEFDIIGRPINLDLIHIVYSLSKDLGFPGFRVGILYSYNDRVVNCARKMSSFSLVSTQTQRLIASMLSDDVFVERLLKVSSERLRRRHDTFTRGLEQVGITSLKSNAGLYVFMDLRRLLKESTFEAELELWRVIVKEVKLNVSNGGSFHCTEPGWFRACFANMDDDVMVVALRRIIEFVKKTTYKDHGGTEATSSSSPKKTCKGVRKSLRISLSFNKLDDFTLSSPRSIVVSPW